MRFTIRRCVWTLFVAILIHVSVAKAEDPVVIVSDGGDLSAPKLVEVKRGHVASYPRVITGKITDAAGKPIAGALVEWGPDYPHDAPRETTQSGGDGNYRLEVQKAGGKYKLSISASGFCPQWRERLIPGPVSAPTHLDWKLSPDALLEVTIVGESGLPIPNLEVTPMTPQSGFNSSFSMAEQPEPIPGHSKPTVCDGKGVCQLHQLLPAPMVQPIKPSGNTVEEVKQRDWYHEQGWLHLRITQDSKWVHEYQISNKEYLDASGRIRIVVPDYRNPLVQQLYNGTLFGQVFGSNGKPVTDYHVTLRHRGEPLKVSDPEGRFQWGMALDPKREYEVRIFAKGFAPQLVKFTPRSTTAEKPERIELVPHPSVEFQLLDEETLKPIPGVPVVTGISKKSGWNYIEWHSLKDYADGSHAQEMVLHMVTDADGRITVPEGDEPKTLTILTPGYARTIVTPLLRPDPDPNGLIQIPLAPAAVIYGGVSPNSRIGKGSSGMSLHYFAADGFDHMFHNLATNEQGEYHVESLAAGNYLVTLMHSEGNTSSPCWTKAITLSPGEHLKLVLGEMTGKLTLSGRTHPFAEVRITRQRDFPAASVVPIPPETKNPVATLADVDGYFEFDHVEEGAYRIEIGEMDFFRGRMRFNTSDKGPAEVLLVEDMHIDFVTGEVTPPGAAVDAPAELK